MQHRPPPSTSASQAQRAAIGRRLRRARQAEGESQEQFAARLGVTKLTLLTYEHGTYSPGADRLALLEQTGVDAAYVAFGSPSLATPQARARFALALEQVKRDSDGSAPSRSEIDLVEAAWHLFSDAAPQSEDQELKISL